MEFVGALCTVAREELRSGQAPRVFSLTKLVEISIFNMGRIRRAARTCLHPKSLRPVTQRQVGGDPHMTAVSFQGP